jgi:hypothetical protein
MPLVAQSALTVSKFGADADLGPLHARAVVRVQG